MTLSYNCVYAVFSSTYQRSPFHFLRNVCTNPRLYHLTTPIQRDLSNRASYFLRPFFSCLVILSRMVIFSPSNSKQFRGEGGCINYQRRWLTLLAIGYLGKAIYVCQFMFFFCFLRVLLSVLSASIISLTFLLLLSFRTCSFPSFNSPLDI